MVVNRNMKQPFHYSIYKITNKINGKIYIGKHKTSDLNDGYMGSGKLIRAAIRKHGVENFVKEVLHIFDNEADMNSKEAELVSDEFVLFESNYNLCPGGNGGFGHINAFGLQHTPKQRRIARKLRRSQQQLNMARRNEDDEYRQLWHSRISETRKANIAVNGHNWTGKAHSPETIEKLQRPKGEGSANSQFGTMWITDEIQSKKILKTEPIPDGWRKGRRLG